MNTDEHTPLWIRGARVIDPSVGRDDTRGEVFAKDGRFVDKLSKTDQARAQVIDAAGLILAPGFVDLNCRLGEPGRGARESIQFTNPRREQGPSGQGSPEGGDM